MILKLDNGADPIVHYWSHSLRNGFVVAKWREEYVVWRFWLNEEGVGICEHGDYHQELDQAISRFIHRVKLTI